MSRFRFSKLRIRRSGKEVEPQEVLLDSLAQKKEREIGMSGKRLEVPLSQKILSFLGFFSLVLILLLFGKTFQLQVLRGEALAELSENNLFIIRSIQAERGVIYDSSHRQLVSNKPSFDLVCRKNELPQSSTQKESVLKKAAGILKMGYGGLKEQIESSSASKVFVMEDLGHSELIMLESQIEELEGFEIENNTAREYVSGPLFSHILGYQRKSGEKTGLEKYYDETLSFNPGELQVKKDAREVPISKDVVSLPESGKSLILWLDAELQEKLAESLQKSLSNVGAASGAAVALDPKTGGIKAMVSLPSFDNNLFSQGMSQEQWQELQENSKDPFINRVISGRYLTGSVIKPLIASGVLQEGIIDPEKKINCQGCISIPHPYDPEQVTEKKDWRVHGWTDLKKALAESCNVYFYTVGGGYGDQEGLGPTNIKKYLELFGWNQETGIDLPGESPGFIPDKDWKMEKWGDFWWDGDTYNMAIGQGYLQITPLEVANAFAAIANGGILMEPRLVKEVVNGSSDQKEFLQTFETSVIRKDFIDSENLEIVREGMRMAVTGFEAPHASASYLNSLPVPTAAKTGTAQTGKEGVYNNWITVFAPYEDPEIVLTVMVEEVRGTPEEIPAAVLPVAKEVFEWYFRSE